MLADAVVGSLCVILHAGGIQSIEDLPYHRCKRRRFISCLGRLWNFEHVKLNLLQRVTPMHPIFGIFPMSLSIPLLKFNELMQASPSQIQPK